MPDARRAKCRARRVPEERPSFEDFKWAGWLESIHGVPKFPRVGWISKAIQRLAMTILPENVVSSTTELPSPTTPRKERRGRPRSGSPEVPNEKSERIEPLN